MTSVTSTNACTKQSYNFVKPSLQPMKGSDSRPQVSTVIATFKYNKRGRPENAPCLVGSNDRVAFTVITVHMNYGHQYD